MSSGVRLPRLLGRGRESEALDTLLSAARSGSGQALVLRGEAGIGKTAMLAYAAATATGFRVIRASGVEAESELAFAGLQLLCAPMLDRIGDLPEPQGSALSTAFGLGEGKAPSRFLVSLAVLGLLAELADDQPLLCLVDDAQWLDRASAQALAFVARRLVAERIAFIVATRETADVDEFGNVRQLRLLGLGRTEARALLDSAITGRMDARFRDQIVSEARGNPLALLELPRGLTASDMAGGYGFPVERSIASHVEESFLRRVRALPHEAQRFLVTAAADSTGDISLVGGAADLLEIPREAIRDAEAAGLVEFGTSVRFRHPLVRSAAYRAATQQERQEAHRALGDATDPKRDPDRRAWHRASAATSPDEGIAAELERSAGRAQARGGAAAAAAFLARAAELTPDRLRRGTRALAAALAKQQAGAFDTALELLDAAELSPLDDVERAQATLLRGQVLFASQSAHAGLPFLTAAAKQFEPLDAERARETYRDALYAALTAGWLPGDVLLDVATAARSAPASQRSTSTDRLVDGLALVTTAGYAAGVTPLQTALKDFRTEDNAGREDLGWLQLASRMAHDVWDFDVWSDLSARLVNLSRATGALSMLPSALLLRLSNRAFAGDVDEADALVAEATAVGEAIGNRFFPHYGVLVLEACRGREAETRRAIEAITNNAVLRGEGKVSTATQWAAAVLYNGLGRYDEAFEAARRGAENPIEMGLSTDSLFELIEAAAKTGRAADATAALSRLTEVAEASRTDWALGTLASARALLNEGPAAEACYRDALERLDRTDVRIQLARAHLTYGEWLRRENRRRDARTQLRSAYEMFSGMGTEAFAERARRELQATGETVRKRNVGAADMLTAQEAQIARLASDGLTNPAIGGQLFISPHTVEWHLRKVFVKLGITSRNELHTKLARAPALIN